MRHQIKRYCHQMWFVNELFLSIQAPIKYAKAHYNPITILRVIVSLDTGQTTDETRQPFDNVTDTFVKTVFSESEGLKTRRFENNSRSNFSHETNTSLLITRIIIIIIWLIWI